MFPLKLYSNIIEVLKLVSLVTDNYNTKITYDTKVTSSNPNIIINCVKIIFHHC